MRRNLWAAILSAWPSPTAACSATPLLGDLGAMIVTARSCVDQRQLRLEDACRVLLIEVVRRDTTAGLK